MYTRETVCTALVNRAINSVGINSTCSVTGVKVKTSETCKRETQRPVDPSNGDTQFTVTGWTI